MKAKHSLVSCLFVLVMAQMMMSCVYRWLYRRDKGVPMGAGVQKDFITVRDWYNLPFTFPFEG